MSLSQSECAPNKPIQPANALGDHSLRQQEHDRIDSQVDAFLAAGGEIQQLEIVKHTVATLKDKTTPIRQRNKPRNKQH